jgi:feruloyl-CoA synthase
LSRTAERCTSIAGYDRNDIGFLVFPNLAGCRSICPDLGDAPLHALMRDPRVRQRVREGMASLRSEGGGSSTYATRAVLLDEPPSIDAGEITDKGYINQRAVLERRAGIVDGLYAEPAGVAVILL